MTRLTFIPAQFIKAATAYRHDLAQFVVGGVWLAPGSTNGVVRAWKVNLPSMTNAGEIPIPNNAAAKDDSVAFEILDSGALLVTLIEAAPGGGGATSQPDAQLIPGVFPALAPGGVGVDTWARQEIVKHESRLDGIAAGAQG
jgi:hypothetical protein